MRIFISANYIDCRRQIMDDIDFIAFVLYEVKIRNDDGHASYQSCVLLWYYYYFDYYIYIDF